MTLVEPSNDPAQQGGGFAALRLGEPVLRALDEIGYSEPTPVQAATYPLAIAGRDIIVQARTGTGKTAAFGIPLVDKLVTREAGVQALVLAPTRELALQSQRELARLGQHKRLHVVAIYGGAPMGRQIEELQSGAQIVSGTPGRVLDHLRRGTLDPSRMRVLVLDEMDEMLSMGFAKELSAILELIPEREKRQTMCFSATVDGEVRRHAERHMNDPEMVSLSSDAVGVEQITHFAYMVSGGDRAGDLVRILEVEDPESAIIFCNMRSETERVAGALKAAGFNADWLNGDLPQRDRERIMAQTREGRLRYLVATDVAARGIDISHLTHVINYTFPESAAVYVHRTGRTGRAGRTGCAVSLVSPDELGRLYYLRLEYKISPIERSIPTRGELNTRQETDRILLLENAFATPPAGNDLAVARRLLTHPDVERILGGLLHTFLGTHDQVDEEAAAVRRTRKPTPVELPPERERSAEEGFRGRDERGEGGGRRRRRSRGRSGEGFRDRAEGPRENDRDRDRAEGAPHEGERDRAEGATQEYERDRADSAPRERDREGAPRDHDRDRDRAEGAPRDRDRDRDRDRAEGAPRERERERERDRDRAEGAPRERDRDRAEGAPRERDRDRDRAEGAPRERDRAEGAPRERERDPAEGAPRDRDRNRDRNRDRGDRSRGRSDERRLRERSEQLKLRESDGELPGLSARDGELPGIAAQERSAPADAGEFSARDPGAGDASTDSSAADSGWDESGEGNSNAQLSGMLYLNLGRRDGVRVAEVARLLRESCELSRAEVGRIRVRDRYTYVDVPAERLDTIISTLTGRTLHDKALAPERARVVVKA